MTVVNMCGICISVCGTVAVVCVYNSYDVMVAQSIKSEFLQSCTLLPTITPQ